MFDQNNRRCVRLCVCLCEYAMAPAVRWIGDQRAYRHKEKVAVTFEG